MRKRTSLLALFFIVTFSAFLNFGCKKGASQPLNQTAAAPQPVTPTTDAQKLAFVQNFYDWYAPMAADPKWGDQIMPSPYTVAIAKMPENFDAPLLASLRKDQAIRTANPASDGITWEPFEDGSAKYGLANLPIYKAVSVSGNLVSVVGSMKPGEKPVNKVNVELRCSGAQCVFVNFHYLNEDGKTDRSDLLGNIAIVQANAKPTT